MIEARILKTFPARRDSVAFCLDIEFQAGSGITVLFGPSGAGKTLTLDCIAGFERPESGRILLDNRILFDAEAGLQLSPQKRNCGYVFQNYALFPHMSLRRNLEFAGERLPRLERRRKIGEMLERFRLADVAGRRPFELSGGQRQRCSIARALIGAPSMLLLDEPARGLDLPLRAEFYDVLRQVRADFRTPILLVTHNLEECVELGDEMLAIREGRIVQSGTPSEVVEHPANAGVARLLGIYNLIGAEILALDPGRNSSRLRIGEHDIQGPYFRGHLLGDRVQVCAMPSAIKAAPRLGRPGPHQIPAKLARVVQRPNGARLEFDNGVAVEGPAPNGSSAAVGTDWFIELPPDALRVVEN